MDKIIKKNFVKKEIKTFNGDKYKFFFYVDPFDKKYFVYIFDKDNNRRKIRFG